MDTQNIHILSGSEAASRMNGRTDIVRRFVLELPRTHDLIRRLLEANPNDAEAEPRVINERSAAFGEKIDDGRSAVATVDGNIAAIAHYERIGTWHGRPVFEIGGNVVLPEYRGMGLSNRTPLACMRKIFAEDPTALCFGQSTEPAIIRRYERWKEAGVAENISAGNYDAILRSVTGKPRASLDALEEFRNSYEGCELVLIDLKKLARSGELEQR